MAYYANQKTVKIHKPEPQKDSAKLIIEREAIEAAARKLSGNEFKLYMFFASDSDNFLRDFSPAHFADLYGVSADTARKLFKQLSDKGFLEKDEKKSNLYEFYLEPHKRMRMKLPKRRIVDEDGVVYELTYEELCKELGNYSKETIDFYWNNAEEV